MTYQQVRTTSSKANPRNFLKNQNFTSIHIQMDIIVPLAYFKKMGGGVGGWGGGTRIRK